MDPQRDGLSDGASEAEREPAPLMGNYGGATYIGEPSELGEREHEAQTSGLAARPGSVMCDYVRCVLPDEPSVWAELDDWLGERKVRAGGWRGWYTRSASVLEGGLVAWCEDKERAKIEGVMVDLPGRAAGSMGARLVPFLRWALERGRVTRVDFAIDDFESRVTRERILEAEADGSLVMRWRGSRELVSRERGKITGWTIYLGERSSECMMRFYDKRAEQGVPGPAWVRCELECKGHLADRIAREYFSDGKGRAEVVVGQINRRVRFVEPSGEDSNRWRWPVVAWWASFIGSIEPGPSLVAGVKPECTVSALSAFVERQAGPSMATVCEAGGGDVDWIYALLDRCAHRLNTRQKALLERVRAERSEAASASSPGYLATVATA